MVWAAVDEGGPACSGSRVNVMEKRKLNAGENS